MMETGLKHTSSTKVNEQNTARTMGSGDMDVFATPAMVALMENAAMLAVADRLPEGSGTVGAMIRVTHDRPSPLGATIGATAELLAVEGRKLTFSVKAEDEAGTIGQGEHVRFIVDREKFLAKLKR